ncbi:MAG: hypothetical protein WBF17_00360 [Phycisphaerae bacterium]
MRQALIQAVVASVALGHAGLGETRGESTKLKGQLFGQPLEVVTQQADLIVVGRVDSVGQARRMSHTPQGAVEPVMRSYCQCRVLVSRAIKLPVSGAGSKFSAGGTIRLEALALPGDGGRGAGGLRCVLTKHVPYLLMIRRLPETQGWILPYGRDNYVEPTAERIKAVVEATRLGDWPWGAANNGLQAAMICKWTQWTHMVRDRPTIFFRTYVALRNASGKTLAVNLRPADSPIWIEARDANGTVVTGDPYRSLQWRLKGEWPRPAEPIAAGEVIFVGQTGKGAVQLEASLDLPAGRWTIHAGYRNARARTEDGKALWTGEVAAKPLQIEVVGKTRQ